MVWASPVRMGGQESINEKLRRAVGSKLMDCFFGPQPLKGASAPLCSAGTRRTLPHSTTQPRTLPHSTTCSGAGGCVSRNKRGGAARHHGFGAHSADPIVPTGSRTRIYIVNTGSRSHIYKFICCAHLSHIQITFWHIVSRTDSL